MAYIDQYGVQFSDDKKVLEKCPEDFQGAYMIPNSVTTINSLAFEGCTSLTSIEIPNSVTQIESYAFKNCTNLTSIEIPNSVSQIERGAFLGCTGLISIKIPDSVMEIASDAFEDCISLPIIDNIRYADTYLIEAVDKSLSTYTILKGTKFIGEAAFEGCTNLTSIEIPNSVIEIRRRAFYSCTGLTSIKIPNSVIKIEYDAFYFVNNIVHSCTIIGSLGGAKCINGYIDGHLVYSDATKTKLCGCFSVAIGEIIIPNSVKKIRDFAFKGCTGLTSIKIPNSVKEIGWGTFLDCTSLISIEIPDSVTKIGGCAFEGCSNLTSIEIPNSVTEIGDYAFKGCTNLTSIEIPDSVTKIEIGVFIGCSGLKSIKIPNSITKIESRFRSASMEDEGCFSGCTSLTVIEIPNSVTEIGRGTFRGCINLVSIEIPDSVTKIGGCAFEGCTSLSSIKVNCNNPIYDSRDNCNAIISTEENTLIVGCKNTKIPNYVIVDDCAFIGCADLPIIDNIRYADTYLIEVVDRSLCTYTIKEGTKFIGKGAFRDCTNLTSIEIPYYVTKIGSGAFSSCTSLKSIKIPNSVTRIEDRAFEGCTGLTSITIPNSVSSVGEWAFFGCTNLTSIEILNTFTNIERAAFKGCSELKRIFVPQNKKNHFHQKEGLSCLTDIIIERDNEKITILLNLAKAYEKGVGVKQDYEQAAAFYQQATNEHCLEAQYILAQWYETGDKIAKNLEKARKYFSELTELKYQDSSVHLQTCINLIEEERRQLEEEQRREERLREEQRREEMRRQEEQRRQQEQRRPYYLFFDTETTGTPRYYSAPVSDSDNWPRLVQIGWIVTNQDGEVIKRRNYIIRPEGFTIPVEASNVHHITTEKALQLGTELKPVLQEFYQDVVEAEHLVGHNIDFDQHIVGAELYRNNMNSSALMNKRCTCTMHSSTNFCAIPSTNGYADYKWPKLQELYYKLFGRNFEEAHDAMADITATKECFFELKKRGII